ncbi:hypothetical protein DPEC_G00100020 [Dallia pectoralis]|uniref:Uncharacterized protein n=1 Tax=Dallia pectoralis TaxID=75939 RepID=A0ACC2GW81_DALPE|nr:hypothetical protein DPEC_G00100020 [Dallia pectoralis]
MRHVTILQSASPSPPVVAVVRQVDQLVEADWNIVDDLAQAQQEDPRIKLLVELKKRNGESRAALQGNSVVRKYAPVWDQLQVQGQRLVRIPPVNSDAAYQVQVELPGSLVPKVLAMLHSAQTGVHWSAEASGESEGPVLLGGVVQQCQAMV